MSDKPPSNTREALIAELLGDVQLAIDKADNAIAAAGALDKTLGASTAALNSAIENYRAQVNDMMARLRVETATMLTKTTEHAANALVGKQTVVLQEAATNAVRQAIADGIGRRAGLYLAIGSLGSALISATIVIVAVKIFF